MTLVGSTAEARAREPRPSPIKICLTSKKPSTVEKTQQPLLRLGRLVRLEITL